MSARRSGSAGPPPAGARGTAAPPRFLEESDDVVDDRALVFVAFETAPDAQVLVESGGRQVAMNQRFRELWNFPPEMLERRDLTEMRRHVARQLRDPEVFHRFDPLVSGVPHAGLLDEVTLLDGRSFERHVAPLRLPGLPDAMVMRWREVTAQRRAEAAMAQAQARLAAVFEHAREAIVLCADDGLCVDANPAACGLLARSVDELRRLRLPDLMHDRSSEDPSGCAPGPGPAGPPPAGVQGSVAGQGGLEDWAGFIGPAGRTGQAVLRRPDGRRRMARFNAVANIQPGLHLTILADATEELLAQQEELETATQMELAMAHADLVFWNADLQEDRITLADPLWQMRLLGYAAGEIGEGIDDLDRLVHPDDALRRDAAWQAHVEGRSTGFECDFRIRHRDGHWVWVLSRGRAIERDAQGRALRLVGIRLDITRRKQAEQDLEDRAFTDGLTGTLNRRRFIELADAEFSRAQRHGQALALLMVDLDHFKQINDRHGHAGGDAVLRAFVATARSMLRASDLFGRVGGEEFALLLPQTDESGATALAQRLLGLVQSQPALLAAGPVAYGVSIGVASHAGGGKAGSGVEALMLAADMALYRAKDAGRNRVLVAPQV